MKNAFLILLLLTLPAFGGSVYVGTFIGNGVGLTNVSAGSATNVYLGVTSPLTAVTNAAGSWTLGLNTNPISSWITAATNPIPVWISTAAQNSTNPIPQWISSSLAAEVLTNDTRALTLTNAANDIWGVFVGNGANLNSLNASAMASGTAPVARLPMATSNTEGIVQPDNSTITITNGVISASISAGSATNVFLGVTSPLTAVTNAAGSWTVGLNQGVIFANTATNAPGGNPFLPFTTNTSSAANLSSNAFAQFGQDASYVNAQEGLVSSNGAIGLNTTMFNNTPQYRKPIFLYIWAVGGATTTSSYITNSLVIASNLNLSAYGYNMVIDVNSNPFTNRDSVGNLVLRPELGGNGTAGEITNLINLCHAYGCPVIFYTQAASNGLAVVGSGIGTQMTNDMIFLATNGADGVQFDSVGMPGGYSMLDLLGRAENVFMTADTNRLTYFYSNCGIYSSGVLGWPQYYGSLPGNTLLNPNPDEGLNYFGNGGTLNLYASNYVSIATNLLAVWPYYGWMQCPGHWYGTWQCTPPTSGYSPNQDGAGEDLELVAGSALNMSSWLDYRLTNADFIRAYFELQNQCGVDVTPTASNALYWIETRRLSDASCIFCAVNVSTNFAGSISIPWTPLQVQCRSPIGQYQLDQINNDGSTTVTTVGEGGFTNTLTGGCDALYRIIPLGTNYGNFFGAFTGNGAGITNVTGATATYSANGILHPTNSTIVLNSGGGAAVNIDNSTITTNSSGQLQSLGGGYNVPPWVIFTNGLGQLCISNSGSLAAPMVLTTNGTGGTWLAYLSGESQTNLSSVAMTNGFVGNDLTVGPISTGLILGNGNNSILGNASSIVMNTFGEVNIIPGLQINGYPIYANYYTSNAVPTIAAGYGLAVSQNAETGENMLQVNDGGLTNLIDTNIVSRTALSGQVPIYNSTLGHYVPGLWPATNAMAGNGIINAAYKYEICTTNASFTLGLPINLIAGQGNEPEVTVYNTTGSLITITPNSLMYYIGTWNCTNFTRILVDCVPGLYTNVNCVPVK